MELEKIKEIQENWKKFNLRLKKVEEEIESILSWMSTFSSSSEDEAKKEVAVITTKKRKVDKA